MKLLSEYLAEHFAKPPARRMSPSAPGKLRGRDLARSVGVRVPEMIEHPFGMLDWIGVGMPEDRPFVVKPVDGCNSRGVLPLAPCGDHVAKSLLGDGSRTWKGWYMWMEREIHRHADGPAPFSGPFIIEEMVGDGLALPHDFKCYCIQGRVAFIHQIAKFPTRDQGLYWASHLTREWEPAGRVLVQKKELRDLPPPLHPEAIVEAAEVIAAAYGGPFVRVDMFEDERGPVFGEITPRPSGGRDKFTPLWDERLGRMWEALS